MSRLEPIAGTEILDGDIRLGHTMFEYGVLKDFIFSHLPEWFVEIGVHEGGLSWLLIPLFFPVINYLGIELDCRIVRPQVKGLYDRSIHAQLMCVDCFSQNTYDLVQTLSNKIIYCDGGHKTKELIFYASACNSGDIIMAHDYYDEVRKVRDVPEPRAEVTPDDAKFLDDNWNFARLPEHLFEETRIIGWMKK